MSEMLRRFETERLNEGISHFLAFFLRKNWGEMGGHCLGPLSALPVHVSDFLYVIPFRN